MTASVLLQLADSAFPAGGLNHSQGLEAAMQSGRVGSAAALKPFAVEVLQLQVIILPLACKQARSCRSPSAGCAWPGVRIAAVCDGRASRGHGRECGTLHRAAGVFSLRLLTHALLVCCMQARLDAACEATLCSNHVAKVTS